MAHVSCRAWGHSWIRSCTTQGFWHESGPATTTSHGDKSDPTWTKLENNPKAGDRRVELLFGPALPTAVTVLFLLPAERFCPHIPDLIS